MKGYTQANKYYYLIKDRLDKGVSQKEISKELMNLPDYEYRLRVTQYAVQLVENGLVEPTSESLPLSFFSGQTEEEKVYEENKKDGKATLHYNGEPSVYIHTPDQLIEYCGIDTELWEIVKIKVNKWDGFYTKGTQATRTHEKVQLIQVKVDLEKRKDVELIKGIEEASERMREYFKNHQPVQRVQEGAGIKVLNIADLHIGAYIRDLLITGDYDPEVCEDRLAEAAYEVNSMSAAEVHLAIVGDIIESFTGLNHPGTWQELVPQGWGSHVVILATEVISRFMSQIANLKGVYIVSGNHDRITQKKDLDSQGHAGHLIAYQLKLMNPGVTIVHDFLVVSRMIGGIQYIWTHGDLNISKNDMAKFVMRFGSPHAFNMVIKGHLHSRRDKKKVTSATWSEVESVIADEMDYRAVNISSIFPGNRYSEHEGFTSSPGCMITESRNGIPMIYDIPL